MSNTVTLTQEELAELKQHQETLSAITVSLGQTELQIYNLQGYVQTLKTQYEKVVQDQETLSKTLSEKYGDGAVNLESGQFTPAS
jgi:hypothetical protein